MGEKIKVLMYCDSPTCSTGFATVSRNICEGLYNTGMFAIEMLGINYWGNPHSFPYKIWPTFTNNEKDPYGRKKICSMIPNMDFDLFFCLQDTFILDFIPSLFSFMNSRGKKYKSIVYYPIDGDPKTSWIKNIVNFDYIVPYTDFAKNKTLKCMNILNQKKDMSVIYHGVDTRKFYPIEDRKLISDVRARSFGKYKDDFVIMNLSRNQRRKDIPRTIAVFKEFLKVVPNSVLYLHMAVNDYAGWRLDKVVESFDVPKDRVIFPDDFRVDTGVPIDALNLFYNSSDVVISTSHGEGFGLSYLEAMATKTPVVMPHNTAFSEIISPEIGYLAISGGDPSLYTVLTSDGDVLRPMVDVNDMVDQLVTLYNDKEGTNKKVENAYKFVTSEMDWQKHIVPKWIDLFLEAYSSLKSSTNRPNTMNRKYINTEIL